MSLRPNSVVHSILYDEESQQAVGVKVIDRLTQEEGHFYAQVIFVNAGSVNSNLILAQLYSERFPNGMGNDMACWASTSPLQLPGIADGQLFRPPEPLLLWTQTDFYPDPQLPQCQAARCGLSRRLYELLHGHSQGLEP